jgi:hypothetical protein
MPSQFPNVFARFPDHWRAVCRLLAADAAFAELCADYETCVEHLHALSPATAPDFEAEVAEFRETARELEQEIGCIVTGVPQPQRI